MRPYVRIAIIIVFAAFIVIINRADAGGVAIVLTDGSGVADGGDGGQTEISVSWTSSGVYATGTQITVSVSPSATSTIVNCGTASESFGSASGSFGGFTDSSAVFTLTKSAPTGTSGSLCLSFGLTSATATSYAVTLNASPPAGAFGAADFGAALYDVLGGSEVNVTAEVPSFLSFSIRNAEDLASSNVCQLGILTTYEVKLCSYRLRISTNATSGFTTTLKPDEPFNYAGNATMTSVLNDMSFASGTEAYGIAFFIGAASGGRDGSTGYTDQPAVEAGSDMDASLTFDTDATPLDFTSATTVLSYDAPFYPAAAPSTETTSLIMHAAAVQEETEYGGYAQTVTYRVTGSF
jgi:hypothetical protein